MSSSGWTGQYDRTLSARSRTSSSSSIANTPRSFLSRALPSPRDYPSLFSHRSTSSAVSKDASTAFFPPTPTGRRYNSLDRTDSYYRFSQAARPGRSTRSEDQVEPTAEEDAYLSAFSHNLHAVLSQPQAATWSSAIMDALYAPADSDFPAIPETQDDAEVDFQPYLRKHGDLAAKYERNHVRPIHEQLSSSRVPSIEAADEDMKKCVDEVPSLFFDPDFDLTDPETFEQVLAMQSKSSSLQDELSTYLDKVEITLLRQVSSRSDRFFEASADQEVMKTSIGGACNQVATLRATMDRLRNGLANKSLDIVSLHRKQQRLEELSDIAAMMDSVINAESSVEALVQCADYIGALDLIEDAQSTLKEELSTIHALQPVGDKLHNYRVFISTQISQRFLSSATSSEWMLEDINGTTEDRTITPSVENNEQVQELNNLTDVLFRLEALDGVVIKYREKLMEEIKVVVKTVVNETIAMSAHVDGTPSFTSDSAVSPPNDSKVSVQLKALKADEFLQCVQMIFEHLLLLLRRALLVQSIVQSNMQGKMNTFETVDESKGKTQGEKVVKGMEEVVRKTCEFAQRSVANLFGVRKEVQASYSLPKLRKLHDATMSFVVSTEELTHKTDYTLRGALFSQLKLFFEKYHVAQTDRLTSTLNHELWKSCEVSDARHEALVDLSLGRGVAMTRSEDRDAPNETTPPHRTVDIGGKSFRVVWSALLTLEIVMNYLSCVSNFSVLATDVLQRSVEILRLFNNQTAHLVLGAGAMQVARLKSISARHLGLASQSLELTAELVPHVKAALSSHLGDRQKGLLEELDRVMREVAGHNEKIFSKFTSIVEDQIMRRYLENVSEVDYDDASLEIPTAAMKGITHSTLKLHSVLNPILPPTEMKDVMSRVFEMFTQKLPPCFRNVQPKTPEGRERVMKDVKAFVESFGRTAGVDFDGKELLEYFDRAFQAQDE